jgi:hypothetical protein
MKQLTAGPESAGWNSKLIGQIGFIKKHLRYPINKHTARPFFLLAAMLPGAAFMIYSGVFTRITSSYGKAWLPVVLMTFFLLTGVVMARRFLKTLRFMALPARRSMAENMQIMEQFLQAHHFAIGRHPQMPEVFQVISQPIPSLKGAREVVIFIADDKRILINSHFTQGRFNTPVGATHYEQMAEMLTSFIQRHYSGSEVALTT